MQQAHEAMALSDLLHDLHRELVVIHRDIRSREEYLEGHIPNSINIVSSELIYHPSKYLYRNVTYYLYCDVGYISEDVCRRLTMQGYRAISIIGGYQNYLLRR